MQEKITSGTIIIKCDCTHNYQNKQYGKGYRVANRTSSGGTRCTVCGDKK